MTDDARLKVPDQHWEFVPTDYGQHVGHIKAKDMHGRTIALVAWVQATTAQPSGRETGKANGILMAAGPDLVRACKAGEENISRALDLLARGNLPAVEACLSDGRGLLRQALATARPGSSRS